MPHPLVIKGQLLQPDGSTRAGALGINPEEGTITAIGPDLAGHEIHDHGEAVVVPGAVDIHVHFRDPGHPHKEDFASGTLAALHGGVTTVGDMPNTNPATTTLAAYQDKRRNVAAKAHVDWFLYGGITQPGPALAALAPVVPAFKIYLGESTGCVTLTDPSTLPAVLAQLHEHGFTGVLAFHAEAARVLHEAGAAHAETPGLPGHDARRPVAAEEAAFGDIQSAVAAHTRAHGPLPYRIHIAHASSARLHHLCHDARLSHGVTPNHLLLHHEMDLRAYGRLNPPLRTQQDQGLLLAGLAAGRVPLVESDHAPHTRAEKDTTVLDAPSGIPGVETMVPLLMGQVAAGAISLAHVVAATATRPAALMGLAKGRLEPGLHADVAVYNLADVSAVAATRLHSRAGWTPFEGHSAVFPHTVYLRGQRVLSEGRHQSDPGSGREAVAAPPGPRP